MNTLPQPILNLIGEFNAGHRDQMCEVLMEFVEKERVCYNCREYVEDLDERRTRKLMHLRYVFCSVVCGINGEEDIFERYAIRLGFNRY
jgi:hypothetical protein